MKNLSVIQFANDSMAERSALPENAEPYTSSMENIHLCQRKLFLAFRGTDYLARLRHKLGCGRARILFAIDLNRGDEDGQQDRPQ